MQSGARRRGKHGIYGNCGNVVCPVSGPPIAESIRKLGFYRQWLAEVRAKLEATVKKETAAPVK